ncbi:MAG TPA: hypothetical protein PK467_13240 [Candidatus Wallbacteria bacterium]|nr:hypothetical protein [Candidatus Wallbacteria bacterium]
MRKSTCVTTGREEIISKRYKEISDIIKKNAADKVEYVVKKIAGISRSAWYKCISKGPRQGLVSASTVKKFAAFSGLSEDIFSGKIDFTAEDKKVFADKLKEAFAKPSEEKKGGKEKKAKKEKTVKAEKIKKEKKGRPGRKPSKEKALKPVEKSGEVIKVKREYKKSVKSDGGLTVGRLKNFASEIEGLNDIKQLETISEVLEKLSKITEKKIDFVSALKEL